MSLPSWLFVSSTDGALYDTRRPNWSAGAPVRAVYRMTFSEIKNAAQFKATLRAGGYAWPGGYPLYFITADGAALSFESARECAREIIGALRDGEKRGGWLVCGCDVNWEDTELYCDHSGKPIDSAYGGIDAEF
jgi:hypothetical protein